MYKNPGTTTEFTYEGGGSVRSLYTKVQPGSFSGSGGKGGGN